jgi:hypothetical protein
MEALRTVCPAWLMDIVLAAVEAVEILVPLLTLESTLLLALWDCFANDCCNTSVPVCGRSIDMSINDYAGGGVCLSITRKRIYAVICGREIVCLSIARKRIHAGRISHVYFLLLLRAVGLQCC